MCLSYQVLEDYVKKFLLFGEGVIYGYLVSIVSCGGRIKIMLIMLEFIYQDYLCIYVDKVMLLIVIDENKWLYVMLSLDEMILKVGWKLISLVEVEVLLKEEVVVVVVVSEEK